MVKFFSNGRHSRNLVEMWGDFIDWQKRRKGENGFLKKVLSENNVRTVFESCLGDGCDSIYLLKEGFDVLSNELDFEFIRKAQENARKENVKLHVSSFDWRELDRNFNEKEFDAVLCTGNSLTYLFNKTDRLKSLTQFFRLIRDNGILIIDERNYQYFLDEKKEILNGKFKYSEKYVYSGNLVHAYPIKISDKRVVMEYNDLLRNKKSHLVLYPFRKGEMLVLLKKAGFTKIEQFSDYRKGFNSKADFYTYLCKK